MLASCILDPKEKPEDKTPTPVVDFKDLTEKDHILFNLQLVFNEFNSTEYDKMLDGDFINYFSEADFALGITPEQWDRATETRAYAGFFDPNRDKDRVINRSLKLTYPTDNWTEITPDDPVQYPDESWYFTSIRYDMSVEVDTEPQTTTYIANDIKLEVTIRWDEERGHYRMIRWRDDV
jgi:hypothetical protein